MRKFNPRELTHVTQGRNTVAHSEAGLRASPKALGLLLLVLLIEDSRSGNGAA